MLFKNLAIYEIESLPRSLAQNEQQDDALNNSLSKIPYRPIGAAESVTRGWVPPLPGGTEITYNAGGVTAVCCCEESKVMPPAVVRDELNKRAAEREEQEGRPLGRREKNRMREEVVLEMLPRAFSRKRYTYAYLHWSAGLLVVDSGTWKAAEELTELLRSCFGTLGLRPLTTEKNPQAAMTHWLRESDWPEALTPGEKVSLEDNSGAGKARVTHQEIESSDVLAHIQAGKSVRQLGLVYHDRMSFTLDADMSIKQVKYLDAVMNDILDHGFEDQADRFDVDFQIMVGEVHRLVNYLKITLSDLGI